MNNLHPLEVRDIFRSISGEDIESIDSRSIGIKYLRSSIAKIRNLTDRLETVDDSVKGEFLDRLRKNVSDKFSNIPESTEEWIIEKARTILNIKTSYSNEVLKVLIFDIISNLDAYDEAKLKEFLSLVTRVMIGEVSLMPINEEVTKEEVSKSFRRAMTVETLRTSWEEKGYPLNPDDIKKFLREKGFGEDAVEQAISQSLSSQNKNLSSILESAIIVETFGRGLKSDGKNKAPNRF